MGLWGLGLAEAKVTFDHFTNFFENVSVGYETDSDFEQMMVKCWGL
jgi:hypothetical protein